LSYSNSREQRLGQPARASQTVGRPTFEGAVDGNKLTATTRLGFSQSKEHRMKSLLALLILAAPLTAGAVILTAPLRAGAADSSPDGSFYRHAAEGGISEVEAGNLAQEKGNSQAVKDFGAMMVKDHSAANDELKALAASKSISLPTSASVGQMASKAKLDVLSGDTFDKSYIKGQIKAHQDTIVLFKKEIASGQDPDAKAFATATLPTIQGHLKKIKMIAADAGITKQS
jgi:putative membrane protein